MKVFLKFGHLIVLFLVLLLAIIAFFETGLYDKLFNKYTIVEVVKSDIDYDNDDIDDYKDILNGAKEFISMEPKYKSNYYASGYPDDGYYVCTDVIWYSLKEAGYDFKKMIDDDIKNNPEKYDKDVGDSNIDFRRVRNIKVFLDNNALVLASDSDFNPGDIVVYKNHIAIVSDKVNTNQENYIIHHDGVHKYEENGLFRKQIIGHYRWKIDNMGKNSVKN